jgi:hypothetical protein
LENGQRQLLTCHDRIIAEALKRFRAWASDPTASPIHADLRQSIWSIALKNCPSEALPVLLKEWATTTSPDGKEVCLSVLGRVSDDSLVGSSLLPFLFNNDAASIPAGDMHILGAGLAASSRARPMLWSHMQDHWQPFLDKVGGNPIVLDRFVRVALQQFADREAVESIEKFFEGKDTSAFNRTLETVKDSIRGRAAYRERDAAVLREVSLRSRSSG